jgi:hypothetical protein
MSTHGMLRRAPSGLASRTLGRFAACIQKERPVKGGQRPGADARSLKEVALVGAHSSTFAPSAVRRQVPGAMPDFLGANFAG